DLDARRGHAPAPPPQPRTVRAPAGAPPCALPLARDGNLDGTEQARLPAARGPGLGPAAERLRGLPRGLRRAGRGRGGPVRRVRLRRRQDRKHTSELQSRENLVCRLLLEKKKIQ